MLSVQSWPAGDVVTAGVRATVGGRAVEVVSMELTRELPRTLPGQVAMSGGVTAATGSLVIAPAAGPSTRVATPWTLRSYPKYGQRVELWVSHDGAEIHVLTGRVDSVSGDVSTREVSLTVVDNYDQLNTEFSHRAIARMMPPWSTTGDGDQRMTGMLSPWVTHLAARVAGFYSTPPMDSLCLVSAPLQGCTWPERGELVDSYRADQVGKWAKYHPGATTEPEGWLSMSNVFAAYIPDKFNTPYNSGITTDRPLSITMMSGRWQSSSSYVSANWPLGDKLRIACTGSRAVYAQIVAPDGTATTVASIQPSAAGAWTTATARWRRSANNSLTVEVTTDTGASARGTVTPPSSAGMLSGPIDRVWVYAPTGCYIAGAQVSFTGATSPASTWKRTASIQPAKPLRGIDLMPALTTRSAGGLLKDQAEAEVSAMWIDEDGNLQYRDRATLLAGGVVKTLTAQRDLLGLSWSANSQSVHRQTTVKYRNASVSIARRSTLVVYEGQRDELRANEDQQVLIEPPDNEEWLAVDSTARTLFSDIGYTNFNSGQGTFIGFTGLDINGDEIPVIDSRHYTATIAFETAGARAWKVTTAIQSLAGGCNRVITQSRADEASPIKKAYQARGLPLVRCMGKGKWSDQEATSGATGPSWATDLTHDAGWFIQGASDALALAKDIAAQVSEPLPVFEAIPIRPDPRLQLGDKVRVVDDTVTGLTITGVVCSVNQAVKAGEHTMTVGLIVTAVEVSSPTLGEFDAWHAGKTLAQFEALWSGQTLAAFDSNPLSR